MLNFQQSYIAQLAMEVELSEVRKVAVKGLKAHVQIPPEDVIVTNNVPFIRLRTQSWTLMQAVFEDNPDAPAAGMSAKGLSLACCNGLNMLVRMRNEAQAAHLAPQGGSTLFDVAEVKKPKKPRMSRIEIQSQRDEHIPIFHLISHWMVKPMQFRC